MIDMKNDREATKQVIEPTSSIKVNIFLDFKSSLQVPHSLWAASKRLPECHIESFFRKRRGLLQPKSPVFGGWSFHLGQSSPGAIPRAGRQQVDTSRLGKQKHDKTCLNMVLRLAKQIISCWAGSCWGVGSLLQIVSRDVCPWWSAWHDGIHYSSLQNVPCQVHASFVMRKPGVERWNERLCKTSWISGETKAEQSWRGLGGEKLSLVKLPTEAGFSESNPDKPRVSTVATQELRIRNIFFFFWFCSIAQLAIRIVNMRWPWTQTMSRWA